MLASGTRLGSYEITAFIGAGGMGEVYRARDVNLKREVALKILPQALAADPGRLARFRREAELLALLDHPHIAGIYGLEEAGDITVNSPDPEGGGQISPDGKWIAYLVNGPGGPELTVRPFPVSVTQASADGSKWIVATNATNPRWSPNGKQLFYITTNGDLVAVDVDAAPVWKPADPRRLFGNLLPTSWSWHPDGDRFLLTEQPLGAGPPPPFTLVLNWLQRLEP